MHYCVAGFSVLCRMVSKYRDGRWASEVGGICVQHAPKGGFGVEANRARIDLKTVR